MGQAELLIAGLLVAVAGLSVLARRLSVPYPIVLVVGGALFGFIPGLPAVKLDPQVVLVVFLPPLVYGAAVYANFNDFRASRSGRRYLNVVSCMPVKSRSGPSSGTLASGSELAITVIVSSAWSRQRLRASVTTTRLKARV